ncbi:MAG TPA: HNH endonuclease [Chthoniobacterales bacterium]|jgi:hypothetical protein|nr:HNH endonuclease [Chthoniobacterales bacterium]
MPFSPEVKREALVAAQRSCCICHVQCGVEIECHHIVPEAGGGLNNLENCIPLCFNCHAKVQHYNPKHPRGNKFTPEELKHHRDKWVARVSNSQFAGNVAETTEIDRQVFRELREILPSDGAIRYIRDPHYGGAEWQERFEQLEGFFVWASLPENEFLDADLNSLTAELIQLVAQLDVAVRNLRIERSQADLEGVSILLRHSHTDAIRKYLDEVGSIGRRMEEVYLSLIRTGRRKLSVR